MRYYFAPMEGLTDMVFRRAHQRHYPGIDRYYTPFISPTQNHLFTPRELRELSPGNNTGVPLVPQLLGRNAEDFLWAVNALADMGYEEVNLNLGCPSSTVTAKGKGSGFLAYPEELERFLEKIYARSPIAVSIKSRLGMEAPEEFDRILAIYNRFPVRELILHPRTRKEQYFAPVHEDIFRDAIKKASMPLAYNGDLFTLPLVEAFQRRCVETGAIMLGRGLMADPAMVKKLQGGTGEKCTLVRFHEELCARYPVVFESELNALRRMKAIWAHLLPGFDGGEAYRKLLVKTKKYSDFLVITRDIFQNCDLKQ